MQDAARIRRIGLIGGGVIGAGWAARAVLNGLDVAVCDPDPDAGRKLGEVLDNARRAWTQLTEAPLPPPGTLRVLRSVEASAAGAQFIQESLPEQEELKRGLLKRADAVAAPEVVIASSTSGLLPSRLQAGLRAPERLLVGHPFNPVYLVPLVEVCGGARTCTEALDSASAFYRRLGMHPLRVRQEIDGFIADRLMEALWREALWLVHDGVATAAEIDDAVRFGPGLRWSFLGTFLTYRIAGGEKGMRHFMAQFSPALKWPWTKLTDVPELDAALLDRIVTQSDAQAAAHPGDSSLCGLERLRDDCLVSVLQALRRQDFAAGATLRAYEADLRARAAAIGTAAAGDAAPLRLHAARVLPDWIDYNGHMTEHRYLQVFGDATDALLRHIGADLAYVAAGHSYYTVETHLRHLAQAWVDEAIEVSTQLLAADAKRIHLFHALQRPADGALLATAEHMLLHVDAASGRACPAGGEVLAQVLRVAAAHRGLPRLAAVGRHVGQRPTPPPDPSP